MKGRVFKDYGAHFAPGAMHLAKGLVRNKYGSPFAQSDLPVTGPGPMYEISRSDLFCLLPKGEEKARGLEAWQTTRQTQDETLMTATEDEKLAAALDLLKRLPPSRVYTYLEVSARLPLHFTRPHPPRPRECLLTGGTNNLLAPPTPKCLLELAPEIAEDLLANVDQPLQVAKDKKLSKQYLLCDYNRDGDSYRYV